MAKSLIAAISLLAASQAFSLDWQRPDCSSFERESECLNALKNEYRQTKQQEFRNEGISFWYYERPDYSDNEKIEQALEDKVEGALLVSFTVERDGSVSTVALKDQSSDEVQVYAQPLLAAVQNWQFVPTDTARPGQEWLFQFVFPQEECEEDEGGEACAKET